MTSPNPLSKHFRQPAIYLSLPSGGKYWDERAIDIPVTGDLPVIPMTAMDEITIRTPDSLYNGQSTVAVIQSCLPSIKNAWAVPTVDLDAILIAIRIASYGNEMEVNSKCPECGEIADFSLDLNPVLSSITAPDYNSPFVRGNVSIRIRPMTYKDITTNNVIHTEQQKIYQVNADTTLSDEQKLEKITQSFKNITELSIAAVARSITSITIDNESATEYEHILEYLKNCEGKLYSELRDYITKLKTDSEIKPLHLTCPACKHEYDSPFTLDASNFFV